MSNQITVGSRIKGIRVMHGERQAELATALHISERTLGKWEQSDDLPLSMAVKIAERYGVSVDELAGKARLSLGGEAMPMEQASRN